MKCSLKKHIMKNVRFIFPVVLMIIFASCRSPSVDRAEVMESLEAGIIPEHVDVYNVDPVNSVVVWEGRRIGGGHHGTMGIERGEFYLLDDEFLGGEVVIDMHQIEVVDIEDPESNARLQSHLESDDFFAVDQYPEAIFEITTVEPYAEDIDYTHRVYGNMTIRGITHGIAFDATIDLLEDRVVAISAFDLDRTEWNVRYGSDRFFDNLGDRAIHDDFGLELNLEAVR